MKLTVKERLMFNTFYPRSGSIAEQQLVRAIDNKIVLSQEEVEEINLKSIGQNLKWDKEKGKDLDVMFTNEEYKFLRLQVEKLDKENRVTLEILDLCLKVKGVKE